MGKQILGEVNMCLAIQQMKEESKIEGAVKSQRACSGMNAPSFQLRIVIIEVIFYFGNIQSIL